MPKLLKVGYDNQLSVFIAAASQPVQVKFELVIGQQRLQSTATVTPGLLIIPEKYSLSMIDRLGATRPVTLTLPKEFPIGAGELTIVGTGGITFEEKRDIIIYDSRHVVLVQTSASTYRPSDTMEVRVVVTNEELMPVESAEIDIEIYVCDPNLYCEHHRNFLHFILGC